MSHVDEGNTAQCGNMGTNKSAQLDEEYNVLTYDNILRNSTTEANKLLVTCKFIPSIVYPIVEEKTSSRMQETETCSM